MKKLEQMAEREGGTGKVGVYFVKWKGGKVGEVCGESDGGCGNLQAPSVSAVHYFSKEALANFEKDQSAGEGDGEKDTAATSELELRRLSSDDDDEGSEDEPEETGAAGGSHEKHGVSGQTAMSPDARDTISESDDGKSEGESSPTSDSTASTTTDATASATADATADTASDSTSTSSEATAAPVAQKHFKYRKAFEALMTDLTREAFVKEGKADEEDLAKDFWCGGEKIMLFDSLVFETKDNSYKIAQQAFGEKGEAAAIVKGFAEAEKHATEQAKYNLNRQNFGTADGEKVEAAMRLESWR